MAALHFNLIYITLIHFILIHFVLIHFILIHFILIHFIPTVLNLSQILSIIFLSFFEIILYCCPNTKIVSGNTTLQ